MIKRTEFEGRVLRIYFDEVCRSYPSCLHMHCIPLLGNLETVLLYDHDEEGFSGGRPAGCPCYYLQLL